MSEQKVTKRKPIPRLLIILALILVIFSGLTVLIAKYGYVEQRVVWKKVL